MNQSLEQGSWHEGPVATDEDHFELFYFDDLASKQASEWPAPLALVGRGAGQSVSVQLLLDNVAQERRDEIRRAIELDLHILVVDHWFPDQSSPWAYLEYWAVSATGNLYSTVHWSLYPRDPERWHAERQ